LEWQGLEGIGSERIGRDQNGKGDSSQWNGEERTGQEAERNGLPWKREERFRIYSILRRDDLIREEWTRSETNR